MARRIPATPQQRALPPGKTTTRVVRVVKRQRKVGIFERLWRRIQWKYKLPIIALASISFFTYLATPEGATNETFVLGPGEAAPAQTNQDETAEGSNPTAGEAKIYTGVTTGISWTLAYPASDNKQAFRYYFANGKYCGDIGDASHQNASFPQDHTPRSAEVYNGKAMKRGWIYAQDFCAGGSFDLPLFVRWILDEKRKDPGKYPEIKYIISRNAANQACGKKYFGFFGFNPDGSIRWQANSGHTGHVHISYKPDYEKARSTVMFDFAKWQSGHSISDCGIS
ncbi:MAG: hypothetical protein PVI21_03415 [Candidatus Woesebacteria bacterium]